MTHPPTVFATLVTALLAASTLASEDTVPRAPRQYDQSITIFSAPPEPAVRTVTNREPMPNIKLPKNLPPESLSSRTPATLMQDIPYQPPMLRQPQKNPDSKDKDAGSGWGWLADDVKKAQAKAKEKEHAKAEADDEDDEDSEASQSAATTNASPRSEEGRNADAEQTQPGERDTYRPVIQTRADDRPVLDQKRADKPRPAPIESRDITRLDDYASRVFSGDQKTSALEPAGSWLSPSFDAPSPVALPGDHPSKMPDPAPPPPSSLFSGDGFRSPISAPSYGGGSLFSSSLDPAPSQLAAPERPILLPSIQPPQTPSLNSSLEQPSSGIQTPRALPW